MLRNDTRVEWKVLLDDDNWNSSRRPPIPDDEIGSPSSSRPMSPFRRRLLWALTALLCVVLSSAGYLLWRTAQHGLVVIETELQDTLVIESWTEETFPPIESSAESEPTVAPPSAQTTVVLHDFDLYDDVACTEIVVDDPTLPFDYRETRAYLQTDVGWLRTSLPAEFWGSTQRLESDYFVFVFRFRDLATVVEAAPRLDTVYTRLCEDLALPTSTQTKIVIELMAGDTPPEYVYLAITENHLRLPSPSLLRIPDDLSDVDLLVEMITIPLAHHLINQTKSNWLLDLDWQFDWSWESALTGVQLWLLADVDDPQSERRAEFIRWLCENRVQDRMVINASQSLPQSYGELCELSHLVRISPQQLALPISCAGDFVVDGVPSYVFPSLPRRLDDLCMPLVEHLTGRNHDTLPPGDLNGIHYAVLYEGYLLRDLASFTLIEYAIDTYGRERLPTLLHEMGMHYRWDTLIPAVYGLEAEEFEAGWQTYLEARYGR